MGTFSDDFNEPRNWCSDVMVPGATSCITGNAPDVNDIAYITDFCSHLKSMNGGNGFCDPKVSTSGTEKKVKAIYQLLNKFLIDDDSILSVETIYQDKGEIALSTNGNHGELKVSKSFTQSTNGKITNGKFTIVKSDGLPLGLSTSNWSSTVVNTLGLFDLKGQNNLSELFFDKDTESITLNGTLNIQSLFTNNSGTISNGTNLIFNLAGDLESFGGNMNVGTVNIIGSNNQSIIPNKYVSGNLLTGYINNLTVNKTSGVLSQQTILNGSTLMTVSLRINGNLLLISSAATVSNDICIRLIGSTNTTISWPAELGWLRILKTSSTYRVNFVGNVILTNTNQFSLEKGTISKASNSINLMANNGTSGAGVYKYRFSTISNNTGNNNTGPSDWTPPPP
jgi:hypothetical protein